MARDTGRNLLRESIANAAARLMAEDGIENYAQAKRKAARQIGATDARQMPTNDEIDAALTLYRDLFQHDHSAQLRQLRELALAVMRELVAFNPYLTGSVLRGSAGKYADIQLQLCCDNPKNVEHYLLDQGIQFRGAETRLYAGDMAVQAPVLVFNRDGYDVYLTLLSRRDSRLPLKTTPAGRLLERAKADAVEILIAES
ncbi:MAG: hypothetical protein ABI547_02670 [Betaproteobacteria bacterium]